MTQQGRYRQVSNHQVSAQMWNEIEVAYRAKNQVTLFGRAWTVQSISRHFLASGEAAIATLEAVSEVV